MSDTKDFGPPKILKSKGSIHPINQVKNSIIDFLNDLGFEIIDGPE